MADILFPFNSFLQVTVTNDSNDEYEDYGYYLGGKVGQRNEQGEAIPLFDHDSNSPIAKLQSRATFVGQIWHQAGKGPIVWVTIKVAFVALASLFAGYFWTAPYKEMLNPSKEIVELFAYFQEHNINPLLLLNPKDHDKLRQQLYPNNFKTWIFGCAKAP